jgi:hypothetical protein
MNEFRNATTPDAKIAALLKARDARAAMSVDKSAYVAATDALRASIANAVAIAVDIALTFAVPGAGGLVARAVISLATNIGTKVAILQDQYNSEMLTGDIVGAVVGMGLGVPSKLAGEGAAKVVGRRLASAATELGYVISPELKAFAATATRIAGEAAETAGSTAGTNVALGKDATEGMGLAFVVAGVKPHMIPIIKGPARAGTQTGTADSDEPAAGSPRAGTPDDDAIPVDDADIVEETPMALPEPGTTTKAEPTPAAAPKRAVGESVVLGDNEVEAWRVYKKWRTDDPSREVGLIYNHAEKKWAVVQGEADKVDTIAAAKALGWDPKDTMALGRHSHPPDRSGVTEAESLQPSGRKRDLDMIKADASKVDSGDGVHWSAIDVTTQHGPDTVYVFYDRKSGVFTVRSPNPAAGPGQYEWNSFPNITYFHAWYRNRFGFEPSPVKLFGQQGGGSAGAEPSAGTPKTTSSGDILDPHGNLVRDTQSPTSHSAAESFGETGAHGQPEARYFVRAELENGVLTADFSLRRMDVPGFEGEYHRSSLLRRRRVQGRDRTLQKGGPRRRACDQGGVGPRRQSRRVQPGLPGGQAVRVDRRGSDQTGRDEDQNGRMGNRCRLLAGAGGRTDPSCPVGALHPRGGVVPQALMGRAAARCGQRNLAVRHRQFRDRVGRNGFQVQGHVRMIESPCTVTFLASSGC